MPVRTRWAILTFCGLLTAGLSQGLHADDTAATPASASTTPEPPHPGTMMMMGKGGPMGDEAMDKELGLTPEQETQWKTMRASERAAMKPLTDKQRDLMKKLESQVAAKAADKDLDATLHDITANRKAITDQAEQFRAERDALFTPMQRAKMMLRHRPMMMNKTPAHAGKH